MCAGKSDFFEAENATFMDGSVHRNNQLDQRDICVNNGKSFHENHSKNYDHNTILQNYCYLLAVKLC